MKRPIADKEHLFSLLQENSVDLRRLGVERIGVFGSFVTGSITSSSDVDFFVAFTEGSKTFDNYLGLVDLLTDLTGRPVEMITHGSLSPFLGASILAEVEYVSLDPQLLAPHPPGR